MEQITLTIPDSWKDITIAQFQEYLDVVNTTKDIRPYKRIIKLLSVLTDTDETLFYEMPMDTIHEINEKITFIQNEPKGVFQNIIKVNGVEYGFQKDMHQLTLGEWIDLEHYISKGTIENLHYISAILYRPIINKGDEYFDYEIKPYQDINLEGTAKLFKYNVNIDDIYGISVFFYTIANELLTPMIYYSQEKMEETEARRRLTMIMNRTKDAEQRKKLKQLLMNKDLKSGIGNYLSSTFVKEKFGDTMKS
jgi:hypothetical protein